MSLTGSGSTLYQQQKVPRMNVWAVILSGVDTARMMAMMIIILGAMPVYRYACSVFVNYCYLHYPLNCIFHLR